MAVSAPKIVVGTKLDMIGGITNPTRTVIVIVLVLLKVARSPKNNATKIKVNTQRNLCLEMPQ